MKEEFVRVCPHCLSTRIGQRTSIHGLDDDKSSSFVAAAAALTGASAAIASIQYYKCKECGHFWQANMTPEVKKDDLPRLRKESADAIKEERG